MKRLVTLTWEPRAPQGINAGRAAHRRPAMEYVGIDVPKNQITGCEFC
jgi:hypothetical protein